MSVLNNLTKTAFEIAADVLMHGSYLGTSMCVCEEDMSEEATKAGQESEMRPLTLSRSAQKQVEAVG